MSLNDGNGSNKCFVIDGDESINTKCSFLTGSQARKEHESRLVYVVICVKTYKSDIASSVFYRC